MLVGIDDLIDMFGVEIVLSFAFLEMLGGVDEQHIIGLLALFEYQDADGNTGGVEQIGRQADHGVDMTILEQFGANAGLSAAAEQHAVG